MSDTFTEVTSQSWFGRIGGAIKGVLIGIILLPIAAVLLFWNESRAVTTAKSLKEGAAAVVDVSPSAVQAGNEGKLIHLTGEVTTDEALRDPIFAVSATALRLNRKVEMYQWKEEEHSETHKKLGGGEETVKTYTYSKAWSDKVIESARFKQPEAHANPTELPVPVVSTMTSKAVLGAFKIPTSIIEKMSGEQALPAPADSLNSVPAGLKAKAKLSEGGIYIGQDPATPAVGDARVTFEQLKPGTFSIIAAQNGDTLAPYQTHAGREIERVESGSLAANVMFQHAATENSMTTWLLRGVGFIVMFIGFAAILHPLSVLGDVVPFIGGIVEFGTTLVAGFVSFAATVLVIAVAWLAARPLLGGTLLVLGIAALVHALRKIHANKRAVAAAPAA